MPDDRRARELPAAACGIPREADARVLTGAARDIVAYLYTLR